MASLLYLHPKIGGEPKPPTAVPTPSPKLVHDHYHADFTFLTPTVGWALVESPTTPQYWIYKTTDSAKTWQQQLAAENTDRNPFYSFFDRTKAFQFIDQTHGLAFIGGRYIYQTSDGGKHWTKVNLPPYFIQSLSFSDPSHGWLIGSTQTTPVSPANTVYHYESTTDGGNTWTALPSPPLAKGYGYALSALRFRSTTEGWAGATDIERPSIYSTKDGGLTWTQTHLQVTAQPPLGKSSATSDITLLPGGGVLATFRDASFISFDGGENWRRLPPPPGVQSYRNIAFLDAAHWWAMQYDGNLYKTADGGKTWDHVSFQLDEMAYEWLGVIDAKHAWARVSSQNPKRHGYGLALTSDGGVHWTYANVPNPP